MANDKILNKAPFLLIGLDKYYGYQTVLNILNNQNKDLLDDVDELKSKIALLEVQLKSSKQDVEILKSDLEYYKKIAADNTPF